MSISLKKKIRKIIEDEPGEHTDISGLKSDVSNLKTAVGKASGEGAGGALKDIADINTAIGDESTEGTILARIKALEDKTTTNGGDS